MRNIPQRISALMFIVFMFVFTTKFTNRLHNQSNQPWLYFGHLKLSFIADITIK